jgi:transposase
MGKNNKASDEVYRQRPDAPSAHRRSGYPLSGCVPAEPDSVSPDGKEFNTTMKKGRSNSDKVVVSSGTKTKSLKESPMNLTKYIGMDVHKAMTVIAVLDLAGKILAEAIIETKASTILDFIRSQRGTLHVALEEGTQAAWLYDLIRPYVANVVVCDSRKIATQGNKADKPDAKRLAELLRTNALTPVYHGEQSTKTLKELARSYSSLVEDGTRIKNRLKALFRGRGIDCSGSAVYSPDERKHWTAKLDSAAVRTRADKLWELLDCVERLSEEAQQELIAEARKHAATRILRSIPGIGVIRAAVILGVAGTPHRFRTKRQFWAYCGLAVVTETSSEYQLVNGRVCRSKKQPLVRGLNRNYNRALKEVFKGAAKTAASGPWKPHFDALIANGTRPPLALLILARKIASITLALWKRGERYDHKRVKMMHAA